MPVFLGHILPQKILYHRLTIMLRPFTWVRGWVKYVLYADITSLFQVNFLSKLSQIMSLADPYQINSYGSARFFLLLLFIFYFRDVQVNAATCGRHG